MAKPRGGTRHEATTAARQQVKPHGAGGIHLPPPPAPDLHQWQRHTAPAMRQALQFQQIKQQPLVEVSDIRRERLSEDDYRNQLTKYIIYRFEKAPIKNQYNTDGVRIKASWNICLRTCVKDMSKKGVARDIQKLNEGSKSLADKKKSLNPDQQRQLEKALEELSREDNDKRFEYTLVQIDHQLKPVDKSGKKSKKLKKSKKSKKKSRESKKIYERVSITAYYKRAPLSIIDAQKLARDIQLEARQIPFTQQQQQRQGLAPQVSPPHGQNIQHPA